MAWNRGALPERRPVINLRPSKAQVDLDLPAEAYPRLRGRVKLTEFPWRVALAGAAR